MLIDSRTFAGADAQLRLALGRIGRGRLTLSKSSIQTFRACQLRYYFRYVEHRVVDGLQSAALHLGAACHAAVAALLGRTDLTTEWALATAARDIVASAADPAVLGRAVAWVVDAVIAIRARGTRPMWIEASLRAPLRHRGVQVAQLIGRIDAGLVDDGSGRLEVLDVTFGKRRVADPDALVDSAGGAVYRLLAGEARRDLRPVVLTELHAPSATEISVEPDREQVAGMHAELLGVRDSIVAAVTSGMFSAAASESACRFCDYRNSCPCSRGRAA